MVSIGASFFVIVSVILTLGTLVSTYLMSYVWMDLQEYPWLFISSSINMSPASNVASLLLSPACLCLPFIAFVRYETVRPIKGDLKTNKIALWTACLTSFGGHGVASFQVRADFWAHMVFAGIFFVGAWIYLVMNVYIDRKVPEAASRMTIWFRALMCLQSGVFFLALCLVWLVQTRHYQDAPTTDEQKYWISVLAGMEIGLFLSVLSVFFSFIHDFQEYHLHLTVHRNSDDESEENKLM